MLAPEGSKVGIQRHGGRVGGWGKLKDRWGPAAEPSMGLVAKRGSRQRRSPTLGADRHRLDG